jgi:chemotaxis protein methyltransferase CheR
VEALVTDLNPTQFLRFSKLIEATSGIHLGPHKIELLRARLAKRMRLIGISSYRQYFKMVIGDHSGEELSQLLDHITTNKTEFFREPQHFAHMAKHVIPAWNAGPGKKGEPLRIWSAACSSGEEVWSLGMTLFEWLGKEAPLKLMGTDLSSRVLHRAKDGFYKEEKMHGISPEMRGRYWEPLGVGEERIWGAGSALRSVAQFHRFNLLDGEDYPFVNKLDAVFCRNVMIYFDRPQQESVVERISKVLRPGGYLYVGLSESLVALKHPFKAVGASVYQLPV